MQIRLNSRTDKNGSLMFSLPREWAEKEVSIIVEIPDAESENNLSAAFDILASMPDDFMRDGIAAHARSLNVTLVTNNMREFARIRDLSVENWVTVQ
jgi:hypothetical protein